MKIVGIICEYNPFHNGHGRQIGFLRERFGRDAVIVCLMSGNFVQRGHPAVYHKMLRAQAALCCGGDLVLEMPVTSALNSAEGFARGGVAILGKFCDELCFGSESADVDSMMETAHALLSPEFSQALRIHLDQGLSFPAARQQALADLGGHGGLLRLPNDILGVEYCKAILAQGCAMKPLVIPRQGDYHDLTANRENPSATALRNRIRLGEDISPYVPEKAASLFCGAAVHTLEAGERAILAKLRTMTEEEFQALPFGSEGLWRKLMHESRRQGALEDIAAGVKSKRYTRTRIDRMILCAFLGLTQAQMDAPAPYTRVLGFDEAGRAALRLAKQTGLYHNVGETVEHQFQSLETRCADLYGLFAKGVPEKAGTEAALRVIYLKQET